MLRYPWAHSIGESCLPNCHECGGVVQQDVEAEIDNQSMSEDGMEQLPT